MPGPGESRFASSRPRQPVVSGKTPEPPRPDEACRSIIHSAQLPMGDVSGNGHSPGGAKGGPCLTDAAQEAAPDAAVRRYAATPRPEHCRGDHRGLRNPGALHLPWLVSVRRVHHADGDSTRNTKLGRQLNRCQPFVWSHISLRVSRNFIKFQVITALMQSPSAATRCCGWPITALRGRR